MLKKRKLKVFIDKKTVLSCLVSFFVFIFIPLIFLGCASSKKKDEHKVRKIQSYPMQVRRPWSTPAHPSATSGGIDYTSTEPVTETLDCMPPEKLYEGYDLEAITKCFQESEFTEQQDITYELIWGQRAEFYHEVDEELTPPCLAQLLTHIPIPREIFFLAYDQTSQGVSCYASGLPFQPDDAQDPRWPGSRKEMVVSWPVIPPPETPEQTIRVLLGWSIAPFYRQDEPQSFKAKIVPESICKTCFGTSEPFEKLKEKASMAPSWP